MHCFLKRQALKDKEGKHLLAVEYFKPDNQLSFSQIDLERKLTNDHHKISLKGMKQFYQSISQITDTWTRNF